MRVGIFITFDFTMRGMIFTEARNYNDILSDPSIDEIVVFDFDENVGIYNEFNFNYKLEKIKSFSDFEKFQNIDVLFTWQWHQQFKENGISYKHTEIYKILSKFSSLPSKKIFFRLCDTRHFMKDYKHMIENARLSSDFVEKNGSRIFCLDKFDRIDYEKCFFVCNGSRSLNDWAWVTLTFSMPFLEKESVKKHCIYLSDDVLFRYSELYEELKYLEKTEKIEKLYHVGNLNEQKIRRFNNEFKNLSIPTVLRLSRKTINDSLKTNENVEVRTPGLFGAKMYNELSSHTAYLFIGNGDADLAYVNKTLYDASIARTVFLIFKGTDCYGLLSEMSDYYFSNVEELREKYEWIKESYSYHLSIQRSFLLRNLSTEKLYL